MKPSVRSALKTQYPGDLTSDWRNIAISLSDPVVSAIAFHEKAGRSQVGS
jgi:hypothetical protein